MYGIAWGEGCHFYFFWVVRRAAYLWRFVPLWTWVTAAEAEDDGGVSGLLFTRPVRYRRGMVAEPDRFPAGAGIAVHVRQLSGRVE